MFNKNITLLLLGLLLILILLAAILYISGAGTKVEPSPRPIPVTTSAPTSSPTTLEDQLRLQTQADVNYAELQDKVLKEFPWYNNLPLQKDDYFVLFDLSKKAFRAKIYPQKSSSVPIDDQVKSYQQEIVEKLKALGVDTSVYPIEWSINPE